MRSRASVVALFVVGCSSADTLPSGGPYGGGAYDASPASAGSTFSLPPFSTGSSSGATVTSQAMTGTATTGVATTGVTTTGMATTGMATTGGGSAPTWTYLFDTYLTDATATIGSCDGGTCHYHSECSTPAACYTWIGSTSAQSYYGALSNGGDLFSWDGGYMPKGGPTSEPQAEADFAAWMAAGSMNN